MGSHVHMCLRAPATKRLEKFENCNSEAEPPLMQSLSFLLLNTLSHPHTFAAMYEDPPESGWLAIMILLCASLIFSSAALSRKPKMREASMRVMDDSNPPCTHNGEHMQHGILGSTLEGSWLL